MALPASCSRPMACRKRLSLPVIPISGRRSRRPPLVVPIAFVSEHSETLVELDIEYRQLAAEHGVPFYARVPVVAVEPQFIEGLAWLVREALADDRPLRSACGGRICPTRFGQCPHRQNESL